jgi:biotin carboxyl carrier protein
MEPGGNNRADEQQTLIKREIAKMKMFRVVVNGNEYKVGIEELTDESTTRPAQANLAPPLRSVKTNPEPQPAAAKTADSGTLGTTIVAPIPGTVLRVLVGIGEAVTKGQTLLVLEAMKMENEIMAHIDGVVQLLNVSQGVSVKTGETLVVLSS